jgi:uncharacterized protein YpmB
MQKITKIIIGTSSGDIHVSKIKDGVAYDQHGKTIEKRAFKHNPKALLQDFEDKELLSNSSNFELAN